ncbi:MFS transporter [Shewanella litoralis]|uniref:Transporter y4wD n=1 Tax=Shewanella litoralis TaxID=2282700 RepID=A0ABQ2QZC7_9GAMM|nr:MFS transporter [Shewanella litoralis]GGQ04723.1 putative transporter y4wD [Shewanella litoralis]
MPSLKNNIYAVTLLFIFNGCLFGSWAAKVPFFKQSFGLDEQTLSIFLLLLALGAVVSFPLAGKLSDKLGVQAVSKLAYVLYPIPFISLALSSNSIALAVSLFCFGFLHGAMDVVMNSWAAKTESLSNRKLMPFFHAMFSLGAGIGAAGAVLFIWAGASTLMHFVIVSALFVPFYMLFHQSGLITLVAASTQASSATSHATLPKVFLVSIGLIAMSCALGEGAIADWSAVIMRQAFATDMSFAAWAYAVFSIFMVLARLLGHVFIEKCGVSQTVRGCALFSLVGVLIIILVQSPALALVGFALMGIGYSVVVPLVFSKAASINEHKSGVAIAFVAAFAYGGMLCGPVVIGVLAHHTSLKEALYLLAILPVYIFITAYLLSPKYRIS